jgi:hypothetical protein
MSQIPFFPLGEPVPPVLDQGDPYRIAVIYRDADGQVITTIMGQQHNIDANAAGLALGLSLAPVPDGVSFNTVSRYGFIDVDDPARPLCWDADRLKADGLTLADILDTRPKPVTPIVWATWGPIKKPTKAT